MYTVVAPIRTEQAELHDTLAGAKDTRDATVRCANATTQTAGMIPSPQ